MTQPDDEPAAGPISDEERLALIQNFEECGFATFRLGIDREAFDVLIDYVRRNQVPTLTDIDEKAGTVTVTRRPFGSLEFG